MCDIASGITVASAITNAAISAKREKLRSEAADRANLYNANMAIAEMQALSNKDGIKLQEERQSLAEERLGVKRENMRRASAARASDHAEGASYNILMGDYARADANNASETERQLALLNTGNRIAAKSYEDRARAKIGSLSGYQQLNDPWFMGIETGLQIGSGVINSYKRKRGG